MSSLQRRQVDGQQLPAPLEPIPLPSPPPLPQTLQSMIGYVALRYTLLSNQRTILVLLIGCVALG